MIDILDLMAQAPSKMSTDSPSRIIDWFEGFAPDFDLEFDPTNQANLQRYCDLLALYQRQASFNLVRPGPAFDVAIKSREPPLGSMYRPLPLFALKGGQFRLVITTGIQNELDRLSQVWVANVRRKDEPEFIDPMGVFYSHSSTDFSCRTGSLRGLRLSVNITAQEN